MIRAIVRWLRSWLEAEPTPEMLAFDLLCALILDEFRRNPEKLAMFQRAARDSGVTIEEAATNLRRALGVEGPAS